MYTYRYIYVGTSRNRVFRLLVCRMTYRIYSDVVYHFIVFISLLYDYTVYPLEFEPPSPSPTHMNTASFFIICDDTY